MRFELQRRDSNVKATCRTFHNLTAVEHVLKLAFGSNIALSSDERAIYHSVSETRQM